MKPKFVTRRVIWPARLVEDALQDPKQWETIRIGKKTARLMSLWDLYMEIIRNPELLDEMITLGLDAFLEKHGWALYEECYQSAMELIQSHNERNEIDDLRLAVRQGRWNRLRAMNEDETWTSACPWQDCPP